MQGKKHGKGKCKYADNSTYIGDYKDDKRHGKGSFEWPDGRKYTGECEKNKLHGAGIYINAKKEEFHCEWEHGKIISENANKLKDLQKWLGRND